MLATWFIVIKDRGVGFKDGLCTVQVPRLELRVGGWFVRVPLHGFGFRVQVQVQSFEFWFLAER